MKLVFSPTLSKSFAGKLNFTHYLQFSSEEMKATRHGFGTALVELGKTNKQVVALSADLAESICMQDFKEKYPQRYIEVGVAEQNLVTLASGLAAVGKIPFTASYACFSPGRNWEQIRTTICYNNQPVKIVGGHAGISVGPDGATHQMLEDIALMRSLPNMIVIVPADYWQAYQATQALAVHPGPGYLRLTREKTVQMTTKKTSFAIGKAQVWAEGSDMAIIGCGPLMVECALAAERLHEIGIKAAVINCHTIKPLDEKTILTYAQKCGRIVTVEEAQIAGGLGGAVAEFLSLVKPTPILRLGMRDHFGESGSPEELKRKFGLDAAGIVKSVEKWMKSNS